MKRTTDSQFRSGDDVVPEWLHNFVGMASGKVAFAGTRRYKYIVINSRDSLFALIGLLVRKRTHSVLCLNDSSELPESREVPRASLANRVDAVGSGLFPDPSEFELDQVVTTEIAS